MADAILKTEVQVKALVSKNQTSNTSVSSNKTAKSNKTSEIKIKVNTTMNQNKTIESNQTSNATSNATNQSNTTEAAANVTQNDGRPSILLTGATHSRELITVQMVLFQLAKLIQNGVINKDPQTVQQLLNNKFLFIPVINVDGLHDIESNNRYRAVSYEGGNSAILPRRKNLNDNGGTQRTTANCEMGVDLNRNYAVDWKLNDITEESKNPCSEFFAG